MVNISQVRQSIRRWFTIEQKTLGYLSRVYETDKGLGFYQRERHGFLRLYLYGKKGPIPTSSIIEAKS